MRSSDFRERLNGIEEFQKLCELETESAIQFLVPIFDGFNECLADTNSKVLLKALNTMHQLIPILADALSGVVNSTLPIVAQNIASKNREISQVASEIIDTAIEYIGKSGDLFRAKESRICSFRLWLSFATIVHIESK